MEKGEQSNSLELSVAQKEELDKRLIDSQNGVGKTYTWDETIAIVEQALKERKNNV
ncbi:hypothetical protein [Mucilaginibacter sp.]|uniref:hypothetical protein n=1 Tax=Mucilaginibacter sp. TaxID=1882438 RepID=UPI0026035FCC|nr:hypothetical protein [Mucilaginibacter sp.]MDB4922614.1 hypothetical protein [Mucilaginibacter sp.]